MWSPWIKFIFPWNKCHIPPLLCIHMSKNLVFESFLITIKKWQKINILLLWLKFYREMLCSCIVQTVTIYILNKDSIWIKLYFNDDIVTFVLRFLSLFSYPIAVTLSIFKKTVAYKIVNFPLKLSTTTII